MGGLHLSLSSYGIHSLTRRTAPGGMWPQEWPQAKGAMCVDDMDLSGGPPRRAGVTSRVSHPVERFPPPWQTRSRFALARHGGCQIASDGVGGPAFVGRGLVCVWRRPVQGFPRRALGSCRQRRVSRGQDEAGCLRNAGFRMRLANRRTNAWRAALMPAPGSARGKSQRKENNRCVGPHGPAAGSVSPRERLETRPTGILIRGAEIDLESWLRDPRREKAAWYR